MKQQRRERLWKLMDIVSLSHNPQVIKRLSDLIDGYCKADKLAGEA